MKPTLKTSIVELTSQLDNWLENLDKEENEKEEIDYENMIEGSYETTFQGLKIVFELQSSRIFDFLLPEEIDILSQSKRKK